jgi:serine/threonine-protein phosphatase 2A regulatory subunit B'
VQKLQQCNRICDFSDPEADKSNKATKSAALIELTTCYSTPRQFAKLTRECHQLVIDVFAVNVFRPLPKIPDVLVDSSENVLEETAWPHLRLVYRLFLQFLDCEIDHRILQYHLAPHFFTSLFALLDFPDARERTQVKNVIARIFEVVHEHRAALRAMTINLLVCVSDTILLASASSLLDLLYIFMVDIPPPISPQMVSSFEHILLPLHLPSRCAVYFESLKRCALMLVRKDVRLGSRLIGFLGAHWPMTLDHKAMLFIAEARQLLDESFDDVEAEIGNLLEYIAMAAESPCTGLAESALAFLGDNNFQNIFRKNPEPMLKIIFPAIYRIAQGHWQSATQIKGLDVMKVYMELNPAVFKTVATTFKAEVASESQRRMLKRNQWDAIATYASQIDESIGARTHEDINGFFGTGRYARTLPPPAPKRTPTPEPPDEPEPEPADEAEPPAVHDEPSQVVDNPGELEQIPEE